MNKISVGWLVLLASSLGAMPYDNGYWASVDYLYWRPQQASMTYAVGYDGELFSSDSTAFQQETEWSSGVRLGLGHENCAGFDASLHWTHLSNKVSGSDSAFLILATEVLQLLPDLGIGGTSNGGTASSTWNLDLNMFDFDLGYLVFSNNIVTFRPYLGIKGGWINQSQDVYYNNFVTDDERFNAVTTEKSDFWGVGPKLGLSSSYLFGCGFAFVADVSGSVLCGHLNAPTSFDIAISDGTLINPTFSYSSGYYVPNMNMLLGFTWNPDWFRCYTVQWGLAYELQYYWGSWRIQNSQTQTVFITDVGYSDLILQGVTAQLSFGF